jgi:hypothetical protein
VPKETATEGEGYFSIIEGHNGRLYIVNDNDEQSYLLALDKRTGKQRLFPSATVIGGKRAPVRA